MAAKQASNNGLVSLEVGNLRVKGVSIAGIYTSLAVPNWDLLLDVGVPFRAAAGVKTLCISHGHADHIGALCALLGMRGLLSSLPPLRILAPAQIIPELEAMLAAYLRMQRYECPLTFVPMEAGSVVAMNSSLFVRAFKTYHPVPSLGYLFFRRVKKIKAEWAGRGGEEIRRARAQGIDILDEIEVHELAYATDTLIDVLDHEPDLYRVKKLILECSFLDERKGVDIARRGCHIHLQELKARAALLQNEHLVLMHISQLFSPHQAERIIRTELPDIAPQLHIFAPQQGDWFG